MVKCLACGEAKWGTEKAMKKHLRKRCKHPDAAQYRQEVAKPKKLKRNAVEIASTTIPRSKQQKLLFEALGNEEPNSVFISR